MHPLNVFASVAAVVVVTACGGGSSAPVASPAAPPSDPSASSSPATTGGAAPMDGSGSPEGGECGDDVAVQKKCAAGLVCTPKPNAPISEHTPGVCKKK
jgi:hypothetical protein